ncbi:LysR family transcriptional regulator [Ruegeria sediminis]|uniref:LysR family transcriptional regulator n=1 Tax=Ruegeria sediminis TaxID=2583820 RepID=A0ABY2WVJ1_9RHOB|nr:LysR family transcriptional regulator [Ruegeria sediminis]TMV06779.1 LysR family transcriptional regulator [Ruegeria sediminis]
MPVAPPRPKPFPLNALRAFEAAARLGGFAAAADELGVSPGAVSAHVKALEDELGAPLFDRNARGVAPTALARRVLPDLTLAFDAMGKAAQTLRAEAAPHVVHIVALPSVAQLWLSPRLPELRAAAPEIEISLTAMEAPPNQKRAPYDLYLFFGAERGETLARDVIFPVCAPAMAKRLKSPADLLHVPCLSDTAWSGDWRLWAEAAMPGADFAPRGPEFSLYALAVEETVNGAGVLMGHEALVARHLRRGQLVAPFETRVELPNALRLWSPKPLQPNSAVGKVAKWLREMA